MLSNIANATSAWASGFAFGTGLGIAAIVGGVLFIAIIVLKGYALWHAAKRNEKWWFIVILILNTLGILELIYLTFIVKKWDKQ